MKRHVLGLVSIVSLLTLTSCSSMLGIGHNNFRCEGTDKGGVCASVDKVYEKRHELVKVKEKVIDREKKEKKEKERNKELYDFCSGDINIKTSSGKKVCLVKKPILEVRVIKEKYSIQPIRIPPKVAKIWIQPYVDKKGNLIDGRYVYVIVKEGGWLLPDGTKIYDDEVKNAN